MCVRLLQILTIVAAAKITHDTNIMMTLKMSLVLKQGKAVTQNHDQWTKTYVRKGNNRRATNGPRIRRPENPF